MTKNTLLNIAIIISRISKTLLIIVAIAVTGLFVYVQMDNNLFEEKEIMIMKPIISTNYYSYFINHSETYEGLAKDKSAFTVNEISTVSLFIFYIKCLIMLFLYFTILSAFEKIILTVKKLETFSVKNVKLFRIIGFSIFIIFLLEGYTILRFEYGMQKAVTFDVTSLIYVLVFFIIAEIFKEGLKLRQENDLTI